MLRLISFSTLLYFMDIKLTVNKKLSIFLQKDSEKLYLDTISNFLKFFSKVYSLYEHNNALFDKFMKVYTFYLYLKKRVIEVEAYSLYQAVLDLAVYLDWIDLKERALFDKLFKYQIAITLENVITNIYYKRRIYKKSLFMLSGLIERVKQEFMKAVENESKTA